MGNLIATNETTIGGAFNTKKHKCDKLIGKQILRETFESFQWDGGCF